MVQDNFLVGDINGNVKKIIERTMTAKEKGAHLVMFPELALVGYPPEDLLHRGDFLKQVSDAINKLEATLTGVYVVFGAPLVKDDQLFNAALWLREGKIIATYCKQMLPNYSVFDEVRYFSAGAAPVIVADDVDIDETVTALAKGGFYHAGQVCVSVQRVFAHKSIARQLAQALALAGSKMKIGDPTLIETEIGPLIRHNETRRIDDWVKDALDKGTGFI